MKIIERAFQFSVIFTTLFCLFSAVATHDAESFDSKKSSLKVQEAEVVRARFGSGPDNLGIVTPKEGSPMGPMSFALGRNGEIYILDQINSRIQVFKDRKRVKTIPVPGDTSCGAPFWDIDTTPDGKIVLLDNLIKKSVYVLNSEGKILGIIPLEGRLIPYAPAVTGIYCRRDGKWSGIWVEVEGRSVRIAKLDGTPDPDRISVPGTFSFDGRRLFRPQVIGDATAVIYRSKEDRFSDWDEYTVFFDMYIAHIYGLWDDRNGTIYMGAFLLDETESSKKASTIVVVLTREAKEVKRVELFVQKMPHEIYRPLRVSPEGNIYQMALDKRGVFVRKFSLMK